jgi:predicted nuclease with TOPRIM domain
MPSPNHTTTTTSEADVLDAIAVIVASGVKPTHRKILAHMGRGSFSTIGPILNRWKQEHLKEHFPDELPNEFQQLINGVGQKIWLQANELAGFKVRALENAMIENDAEHAAVTLGLESTIGNLTDRVLNLKADIQECRDELRLLQQAKSELSVANGRLEQHQQDLTARISSLDEELSTAVRALGAAKEKNSDDALLIAGIKQENTIRSTQITELSQQATTLQDAINASNNRIGQLMSELETANQATEDANARKSRGDQENETLKLAMSRMQKQIYDLEHTRSQHMATIEQGQRDREELSSAKSTILELRGQLVDAHADIKQTSQQQNAAHKECTRLQGALDSQSEKYNELRIVNAQLEAQVTTMRDIVHRLRPQQAGNEE